MDPLRNTQGQYRSIFQPTHLDQPNTPPFEADQQSTTHSDWSSSGASETITLADRVSHHVIHPNYIFKGFKHDITDSDDSDSDGFKHDITDSEDSESDGFKHDITDSDDSHSDGFQHDIQLSSPAPIPPNIGHIFPDPSLLRQRLHRLPPDDQSRNGWLSLLDCNQTNSRAEPPWNPFPNVLGMMLFMNMNNPALNMSRKCCQSFLKVLRTLQAEGHLNAEYYVPRHATTIEKWWRWIPQPPQSYCFCLSLH